MTHDEIMAMTDDELDCAVAVSHGWEKNLYDGMWLNNGEVVEFVDCYHPSSNGNQLIEIMSRELISVMPCAPDLWESEKAIKKETGDSFYIAHGNTIGQAVLRCYLLSKIAA